MFSRVDSWHFMTLVNEFVQLKLVLLNWR